MSLMLLSGQIESSEKKFRNLLEEFFRKIYNNSFLPSHGIGHHQRVWHYAKEILHTIRDNGFETEPDLTDKLIISCFLHDSGMVVDPGINHGPESRKFCERFLYENNITETDFTDVLDTITNHDNKEYISKYHPSDLMSILSVADDLDAFGFIGIYRYLEIYLTRNKTLEELGFLITENSENRFRNFINTYSFSSQLIERHSLRFNIINSFFNEYNNQITSYKLDNKPTTGYCGIAKLIREMIQNNLTEQQLINYSKDFPDPVIQWFFGELEHELLEFR
jgi:hypothetical protein